MTDRKLINIRPSRLTKVTVGNVELRLNFEKNGKGVQLVIESEDKIILKHENRVFEKPMVK